MATEPYSRNKMAQQSGYGASSDALMLQGPESYFEDDALKSIRARSLTYLRAGIPVHFRGPAGTGKTTLAIQIAAHLGRPTVIVVGDSMLNSAHLLGEDTGSRTRQVVDRYVQSVKRVETQTETVWTDNVLTRAVIEGYTLIYDEFTRSPPAANNPLLSAFEERMLVIRNGTRSESYVRAHPDFRAILTSNPQDYVGVNTPQDALMDRLVTFDFEEHDRATEIGIVATATDSDPELVAPIVDIIRALRGSANAHQAVTMRSALMIVKVVKAHGFSPSHADPRFVQLCFDILKSKAASGSTGAEARSHFMDEISTAIKAHCLLDNSSQQHDNSEQKTPQLAEAS